MKRLSSLLLFGCLLPLFPFLGTAQNRGPSEILLFERYSNQWFEGAMMPVTISPDGKWALLGTGSGETLLYSLSTGHPDATALKGSLDTLNSVTFCGHGSPGLARRGTRGAENGWFLPDRQTEQLSGVPATALPLCSPDGSVIAYSGAAGLSVGPRGNSRTYNLRAVSSPVFSSDAQALYYLTFETNGEASLYRLDVQTGQSRMIVNHLDTSRYAGPIALSPDGARAFVPLASDGAPDNESRHNPKADRWLKIYEINLASGARRRIVDSPGQDNTGPVVADGSLYWTRTVVHDSIVTVPVGGGDAKEVIAGGEFPMWNPNGSKIGYYFGGWRIADWALNLDDAVVSVDANGNRTSEPSVIVSGYHEDFPPAWSPDGKWIAFHSHRSPTPVADYFGPGQQRRYLPPPRR